MAKTPVLLFILPLFFILACSAGQIVIATSTPLGIPSLPVQPAITYASPQLIPTIIEAEDYKGESSAGIRLDSRGKLSEGEAVHIGGDNNVPGDDTGWIQYQFNILVPLTITTVNIRYADDVGGDAGVILLDGNPITSFNTVDTGTWDDYVVTNLPVDSIQIQPGLHTLKFEVTDNGTYGITVDYFQIALP